MNETNLSTNWRFVEIQHLSVDVTSTCSAKMRLFHSWLESQVQASCWTHDTTAHAGVEWCVWRGERGENINIWSG